MILTILGKRWDLRFVNRVGVRGKGGGDCDPPDVPNKKIRIARGQTEKGELEAVIHECLHAAYWHHEEEHVEQLGVDLANALWRLGWRKHGK